MKPAKCTRTFLIFFFAIGPTRCSHREFNFVALGQACDPPAEFRVTAHEITITDPEVHPTGAHVRVSRADVPNQGGSARVIIRFQILEEATHNRRVWVHQGSTEAR
jgi:hypothetical protein